jgi:hypothetical protein
VHACFYSFLGEADPGGLAGGWPPEKDKIKEWFIGYRILVQNALAVDDEGAVGFMCFYCRVVLSNWDKKPGKNPSSMCT